MSLHFRAWITIICLVGLLVGIFRPADAQADEAQKRIALLIGNKGYVGQIPSLKNPHKDVELIRSALIQTGMLKENIIIVKDGGFLDIKRAISKYVRKLRHAGQGAVGLFYYSGHGAANEYGDNHIIPIDVETANTDSLWDDSMTLEFIIDKLKRRAKNADHYVIFDACRNTLRFAKKGTKVLGQAKGFHAITSKKGMLIAFATEAGKTAADGEGDSSPYARELALHLVKPDLEATNMFVAIQKQVFKKTGQSPWLEISPALKSFWFGGKKPLPRKSAASKPNILTFAQNSENMKIVIQEQRKSNFDRVMDSKEYSNNILILNELLKSLKKSGQKSDQVRIKIVETRIESIKRKKNIQTDRLKKLPAFINDLRTFIKQGKGFLESKEEPENYKKNDRFRAIGMLTGRGGGTYMRIGYDIFDITPRNPDMSRQIDVIRTKGSVDNIYKMIERRNSGIAIVQADIRKYDAFSPKVREKFKHFKLVMPLYDEELHVFARKGIDNFLQLQNRRVAIGSEGSGSYITARQIISKSGINVEEVKIGGLTAIEQVLRGTIDAAIFVTGAPSRLFEGINNLKVHYRDVLNGAQLIPVSGIDIQKTPYSVAQLKHYPNIQHTHPLQTISVKSLLISTNWGSVSSRTANIVKRKHKKRCEQIRSIVNSVKKGQSILKNGNYHPKWKQVNFSLIKQETSPSDSWKGWKYSLCLQKKSPPPSLKKHFDFGEDQ